MYESNQSFLGVGTTASTPTCNPSSPHARFIRHRARSLSAFFITVRWLVAGLFKNRITERTRDLLIELAHTAELATWMQRLQAGDAINVSEQRAVMHHALRAPADSDIRVDGENIVPSIQAVLQRVGEFVEKFTNNTGGGITANRFDMS